MRNKCDNTHTESTSHNPALYQTANPGAFLSVGAVNNFQSFPEGCGYQSVAG